MFSQGIDDLGTKYKTQNKRGNKCTDRPEGNVLKNIKNDVNPYKRVQNMIKHYVASLSAIFSNAIPRDAFTNIAAPSGNISSEKWSMKSSADE